MNRMLFAESWQTMTNFIGFIGLVLAVFSAAVVILLLANYVNFYFNKESEPDEHEGGV